MLVLPTIFTHAFWVCTQKADWAKDPPKETCYYLNCTATDRSRKTRSQRLPQLYFKPSMCFESGTASDTENKESRVLGNYLKFHWPLSSPTLLQQMPPSPRTIVGQNIVQRFCRMSHQWSKYTNKQIEKKNHLQEQICGGAWLGITRGTTECR